VFNVTLPFADPLLGRAGDDELIVVVKTVSASDAKLTFESVNIRRAIRPEPRRAPPASPQGAPRGLS
jgi:hypothetical protein